MNRYAVFTLMMVMILAAACTQSADAPDVEATVAAGILSTQQAQDALQATVDGAVEATLAAQPTLSPTVPPEELVQDLSEEELAAEVETLSAEAEMSIEAVNTATDLALEDGTLTEEEAASLDAEVQAAYDDIVYLLTLASYYSYYYGDLAEDTLELLLLLEDDLEALLVIAAEYDDELAEIILLLEQGSEVTEEVLDQLSQSAEAWDVQAEALQEQAQAWQTALQAQLAERQAYWQSMEPTELAENRAAALGMAQEYLTVIRAGLEDGIITTEEMNAIAQWGANVVASLESVGGPKLQSFVPMIQELTGLIAIGDFSQAFSSFSDLEANFPLP